jgi:hypothetical protein
MRTVTYGSDSIRHVKEWDKVTGMFLGAVEPIKNKTTKSGWYIEDLTVTTKAVATNMWSPQILGLDQTVFYGLVTIIVLLAVLVSSSVIVLIRKRKRRN